MVAARFAIGFMFLLASSGRVPAGWLSVAGTLLVLLIFVMATLQRRWGSTLSRTSWLFDGVTLGLLTPLLIVNAFAATGDGPLSSAERSIYLITVVGTTIVLVGMILYGSHLSGLRAYTWGILLVPASLSALAVMSAYADYKTSSIVLALAIAWFVSVPIAILAHAIPGGIAALCPALSFVVYLILTDLITGAGLTFGGRPAPVSVVHPVLLIVFGVALLAPLLPSSNGLPSIPGARRSRPPRRRTARSRPRRPQYPAGAISDEAYELDDLEEFRT